MKKDKLENFLTEQSEQKDSKLPTISKKNANFTESDNNLDDSFFLPLNSSLRKHKTKNPFITNLKKSINPYEVGIKKHPRLIVDKSFNSKISEKLYHLNTLSSKSKIKDGSYLQKSLQKVKLSPISKNLPTENNPIITEIIESEHIIVKNKPLVSKIANLKELRLLKSYNPQITKQSIQNQTRFIINDYHSRSTNAGYIRNYFGSFFTK